MALIYIFQTDDSIYVVQSGKLSVSIVEKVSRVLIIYTYSTFFRFQIFTFLYIKQIKS